MIRSRYAADAVAFGWLRFSPSGAVSGLTMCLQILDIILALTLLVRGTEPVQLAEGAELMLAGAKRIGMPVHEAVMMFSIALRFLPIVARETAKLQVAQLSRGGGVQRRGVLTRVRAVGALLLPVFIVALTRAKELAEAMDARGYRGDIGRTRIREYRLTRADLLLTGASWVALVAAVADRLL